MFVRSLTARLAKKLSPSTVTLSKQTKSETVTDDLSSSNQVVYYYVKTLISKHFIECRI